MEVRHHLHDKARSLRLSGIMETLNIRIQEAQERDLGYEEFLEILLTDEIERREAKKLELRLRRASFDQMKSLEEFNFKFNQRIPAALIRDLARCTFISEKQHILICGQPGVGKTHIAQAIGHQACRSGYDVRFMKASGMFRKLLSSRADDSWQTAIKALIKPDLLIIDDFGLRPLTQMQAEDIYEIISERFMKRSIIITSNRTVDEWVSIFPDPLMAHSALDRLAHNAHQITIEGESYRKAQRMSGFGERRSK